MKGKAFAEWLGVEIPMIQAPMAGVQDSQLALAVSRAGGLGSIPCGMLSKNDIVTEIERFKAASGKPFNLNFFCHQELPFDAERHAQWRQQLSGYFERFDIDESTFGNKASRLPFSNEIADAIAPYSPPVVSFHFGLPDKSLLAKVKGWGAKVLSSATTVEEAIWLERNGCDAVILQGLEAGGHRGMFLTADLSTQLPVFELLQAVSTRVSLPLIIAGGIATREDVGRAFELGASAVQIGTAFLLCDEAKTSALHRQALKSAKANHTEITNIFSGRPARGIVNGAMSGLGSVREDAPYFPYASIEMGPLRAAAEKRGSDEFTPLWSGMNNGHCKETSAADIIHALMGIHG